MACDKRQTRDGKFSHYQVVKKLASHTLGSRKDRRDWQEFSLRRGWSQGAEQHLYPLDIDGAL